MKEAARESRMISVVPVVTEARARFASRECGLLSFWLFEN
jgi:hypothetical protein